MNWFFAYFTRTGVVKFETREDPSPLDTGLELYTVPKSLIGPNGEQLWKRTHIWSERDRKLIPISPESESQDRLDFKRLRSDGVVTDADLKKAVELILKTYPDRMFS